MSDPEICICAAIRTVDGTVIRGHRHHDCLRSAGEIPNMIVLHAEQGFITSRNRFVDRREGLKLQLDAGKASMDGPYRSVGLFSENLY